MGYVPYVRRDGVWERIPPDEYDAFKAAWERLYTGAASSPHILRPAPPANMPVDRFVDTGPVGEAPQSRPPETRATRRTRGNGYTWWDHQPPPTRPGAWVVMAVVLVASLYFVTAMTVFGLRHPWLTDVQRLLLIGKALTFDTVPAPAEVAP